MAFVKVLKNRAYSKRYQTKWRRRREGKTDYFARRRLVINDKDKYDSKKYRFVVRRTNRRIICSVNFATIEGDKTLTSADSQELRRFGVHAGLTNYAAAYATGLLTARRLLSLKQIGMADMYKGAEQVSGEYFNVESDMGDRRPFKAFLDVGLVRTTTGNRVFGAMKGACDGGLNIPHKEKRFPGYHIQQAEVVTGKRGKKEEVEKAKATFDAKEHKEHIFGEHVQNYMDMLRKDDAAAFKSQFSKWDEALKKSGSAKLGDLYKKVHAAIRKDPTRPAAKKADASRKVIQKAPQIIMQNSKGKKWLRQKKISYEQRKERVQKKIQAILMAE